MPMAGEHLSDCPALLHVLSQDNCGVIPARATFALYWTARRLMSERTLAGLQEGFLATDHVILNHGQVTWTTPQLAPLSPNYYTTPTG
ncbi:hypothetical protein TNCV_2066901 [Trichonephila clavipes]|uniref:Uncharacterized protein n=1 Tax=Trichonephila clavipes TaxID=2585209 RepID=A0A8X6W2S3_TRICX|nr:hypothetical protein TNCV_2066901 [Trichonephila clavipes]